MELDMFRQKKYNWYTVESTVDWQDERYREDTFLGESEDKDKKYRDIIRYKQIYVHT